MLYYICQDKFSCTKLIGFTPKGVQMPDTPTREIFVLPITNEFKVGDEVVDITAKMRGWPDNEGVVQEVDGSMVRVMYPSGAEHWKMYIHVRKK